MHYPASRRFQPRCLQFADRCKGGNGLALQAYLKLPELLEAALTVVNGCACTATRGCPACVQMLCCSEYNVVLDKQAGGIILAGMLRPAPLSPPHSPRAAVSPPAADADGGGPAAAQLNLIVLRQQRTLY